MRLYFCKLYWQCLDVYVLQTTRTRHFSRMIRLLIFMSKTATRSSRMSA